MSDLALHPEATPDPDVVRWRFSGARCDVPLGALAAWPEALTRAGVGDVVSEPGALVVRLSAPHTWASDGAAVRDALSDVLADASSRFVAREPGGVEPSDASSNADGDAVGELDEGAADDTEIAEQARVVVADVAEQVAHSHGGDITLLGVERGVVTVSLTGACDGCPAAAMTLHRRIEDELRARVGGVREVRAHTVKKRSGGLERGGRALLQWAHERRR